MSKHTPGPWFVTDDAEAIGSNAPDVLGNIVCEAPLDFAGSMVFWPANARLVAAAPDLLEACRYIVEAGETGDEETAIAKARAAISKAEGLNEVGEQGTAKR